MLQPASVVSWSVEPVVMPTYPSSGRAAMPAYNHRMDGIQHLNQFSQPKRRVALRGHRPKYFAGPLTRAAQISEITINHQIKLSKHFIRQPK